MTDSKTTVVVKGRRSGGGGDGARSNLTEGKEGLKVGRKKQL
jgi:hypothetical protein